MAVKNYLILLLIPISILSCSKENVLPQDDEKKISPPIEQAIDYLPFEVGQYWIYQGTVTDLTTEIKTPIGKLDSLYISSDTLINRHQYFVVEGTRLGEVVQWWLRPSGTELLDEFNHLIFSMEQLQEPITWPASLLPEGVSSAETVLRREPNLSVTYGDYPALTLDQTLQLDPYNNSYQGESVIEETIAFGKGIGPVLFSRTLPQRGILIEMQLIRSSLN